MVFLFPGGFEGFPFDFFVGMVFFFNVCFFECVFSTCGSVFESFIVGDDSIKKVSLQDFQGYAMNRQRLNSKEPLFVYKC